MGLRNKHNNKVEKIRPDIDEFPVGTVVILPKPDRKAYIFIKTDYGWIEPTSIADVKIDIDVKLPSFKDIYGFDQYKP